MRNKFSLLKSLKNKLLNVKCYLLIVFLVAAFLRFYKLNWGEGYFFHPDERNVVSLILSLTPPLNWKFITKGAFSYGSLFPLLTSWINFLPQSSRNYLFNLDIFSFVTLFLRSISAVFSVLGVYVIYLVGKEIKSRKIGLLAAIFLTFSPGLIQSAHFLTYDSIISTLYLLILLFNLRLLTNQGKKNFFLAIFFTSIAAALKINSLILGPLSIIILFIVNRKKINFRTKFLFSLIGIIQLLVLTILFSPYYLTKDFRGMFNYEQAVVKGTLDVFYTRSFLETKPIIFQFLKILPFQVNPFIIILFILLVIIFLLDFIQRLILKRGNFKPKNLSEIIIFVYFIITFFPNAFMYAKWSRYIIPAIPFLILLTTIFIDKYLRKMSGFLYLWLSIGSLIWGLSFMSIYFNHDTRVLASEWIYNHIPTDSIILSETANVVDIPFSTQKDIIPKQYFITNFDFYNLDGNSLLFDQLTGLLSEADYIFVPSRRLFAGMGQFPNKYPFVYRYYQLLFSGEIGFEEVQKISSYPKIFGIDFPDENAEETWSVFDHPVIRIYKKVRPLTKEDYEKLLH